MLCPASAYQRALCSIVEAGLQQGSGGVRGVSNALMELRNICNHPFLSRLHVPGSEHALPQHALPHAMRLGGKLAVLDRLLVKLTTAGHKVLLPAHNVISCIHFHATVLVNCPLVEVGCSPVIQ